jgi:hypothetical protein
MEVVDALSQHTKTGTMPAVVGQLSPEDYFKYVEETRAQPAFRTKMDKAADYYDGNQLNSQILQDLELMGLGSLMTNLVKPAIDAVLGIEAKTRQRLRVTADADEDQDVAEALSAQLAEAERESRLDRACSDAYGSQTKVGLGWVHVGRQPDPFLYKYKAEAVHRREMFWDWSTPISDPGLDTSRYLIRAKWFPTEQVKAAMPQHGDLINASAGGWQPDWLQRAREDTSLLNAYDQETRMSVSSWDWRNIDNRRIALQEVWYAKYIRGLVLNLGDKVVEFDKKNRLHMAAVGSGRFTPTPAIYRKLRSSIWFGPHLLQDYDANTNKFPYVPFWGFREDLTGTPYGLIRSMIPLQDEVNARRRKLMWLLSSKRVQIDSDALDARFNDFADLVDEVSRPDAMIVTNPTRTNKDAVKVESDLGLSQQQFEVLAEAKQGIQDAAGIFNSVMGKKDTGADSGLAMNTLVEQSSNTLGELNDNFRFARQEAAMRLLDMIRQDSSGKQIDVVVGETNARKRTISLNTPQVDELTGIQYHENSTDKTACKVALEEIPTTPAYRAQQQMMLSEVIKSLPPVASAALTPYFIEGSDLPKRHEMADAARKAMGMPIDGQPQDPQVAALQQQLQDLHTQSEDAMQKYEQAVQEQSSRAEQASQQVSSLKLQLTNKQSELELRHQELVFAHEKDIADKKIAEAQALAQANPASVPPDPVKMSELSIKERELALKEKQHELATSAQSADHQHRTAELEHNQLVASQTPPEEPETEDEGAEEARIQEIVTKLVDPIAQKLDLVLDALSQAAQQDKTEKAAKASAQKEVQQQQAAAQPAAAAPKKRKVTIQRDTNGRMTGAVLEDHGDS